MSALTDLFTNIANAIRAKTGSSESIVASDFPTEIANIETTPNLQNKSVEITTNTTTTIEADQGYDGLGEVAVTTNIPITALVPTPKSDTTGNITFRSSTISVNMDFKSVNTYTSNFLYDYRNLESVIFTNSENITRFSRCFDGCNKLQQVNAFSVNTADDFSSMFNNCASLVTLPAFQFNPALNPAKSFNKFCSGCTLLENVSEMNLYSRNTTSNKYLQNMFSSCPALTNESLNNILASLLTATALTANKTLAYIGLSSTQATTCTTLSNWQALSDAGWTTGY